MEIGLLITIDLKLKDLKIIELIEINSIKKLFDNGKIIGALGKEPPLIKNREEFKWEEARKIWKKLIANGWRRTNLFD